MASSRDKAVKGDAIVFIGFPAIDGEEGTENLNDGSGSILGSTFCARKPRQVKHL